MSRSSAACKSSYSKNLAPYINMVQPVLQDAASIFVTLNMKAPVMISGVIPTDLSLGPLCLFPFCPAYECQEEGRGSKPRMVLSISWCWFKEIWLLLGENKKAPFSLLDHSYAVHYFISTSLHADLSYWRSSLLIFADANSLLKAVKGSYDPWQYCWYTEVFYLMLLFYMFIVQSSNTEIGSFCMEKNFTVSLCSHFTFM